MKRLFDEDTKNARDSAVAYAKLVLPNAEKVGADVAAMKKRMAHWVTIVENYERDIREAWNNTALSVRERAHLVRTMRTARNQLREQIFGA